MADDDDENRESQDSSTSSAKPTRPAAEGSWWGSWGQGWIDTVKEKSAQTMQMVKKDLNEFVDVIQGDTSVAMSETASKIKEGEEEDSVASEAEKGKDDLGFQSASKVVKKGVANFLQSVSELMAVPPDDSKEEVITVSDFASSSQYNRRGEKLHALQIDPGTYCNEPEGLFNEWLEVFNLDDNKLDMSNMLVQNPAIRAIYTQLVPAVVSHTMFWQRYYYQVFLLDAEEKKREAIVARASHDSNEDDTESGWGDDDDDDGIEVLSSSTSTKTTNIMDFSIISKDNISEEAIGTNKDDLVNVSNTDTELDIDTEVVITKSSEEEEILDSQLTTDVHSKPEELQLDSAVEKCDENEVSLCEPPTENVPKLENLPCEQVEDAKKIDDISGDQMLEISSDIIDISCNVETESDNETIRGNSEEVTPRATNPASSHGQVVSQEHSETSSISSWLSIDDVIKVKKINGEQIAKSDSNGASANVSTDSNGVFINKSDIIDESDEDFDLDIEDDVNEDEVAKMVEEIKNKAQVGTLEDDDDDDWENWE